MDYTETNLVLSRRYWGEMVISNGSAKKRGRPWGSKKKKSEQRHPIDAGDALKRKHQPMRMEEGSPCGWESRLHADGLRDCHLGIQYNRICPSRLIPKAWWKSTSTGPLSGLLRCQDRIRIRRGRIHPSEGNIARRTPTSSRVSSDNRNIHAIRRRESDA